MTFSELTQLQAINEGKCLEYSNYFRARRTFRNTSHMVPPAYRNTYFTSVSYCRMACQAFGERIELDSVTVKNADASVNDTATKFLRQVLDANGGTDLMNQAHMAAMELGRSYLVPSGSERSDGLPVIQVVSARDMIHKMNPYTGEIAEALRVYGRNRENRVYYTPERTVYLIPAGPNGWSPDPAQPPVKNETGKISVFPLTCRGEIGNPWGRPEAKDAFTLQDAACRISTDMAYTSATMATPLRGITGAEMEDFAQHDANGEVIEGTTPSADELYTSKVLAISNESAKLVEFTAAQLQNFAVALNSNQRQASSALGVSQQVFGVSSDANPASTSSMAADDQRQIRRCEQLTRGFEPGWVGMFEYLLWANGSGSDLVVSLRWVDPSLPNLSSRAAAVFQLAAVVVDGKGLYDWEELRQKLGDSQEDIDAAKARREVEDVNTLLNNPPPAERLLPARAPFDVIPKTPSTTPTSTTNGTPAQAPTPAGK